MDAYDHDQIMAQQRDVRASLEATLARLEERNRQWQAPEASPPQTPPRPWDPKDFDRTIAQVRRMAQKDVHPTWFQAAYADLAGRLAQVEDRLEHLEDSLSLLHSKMEMIIGQLAAAERPANGRDA